jgi:hypothetical protein
VTWSTKIAGHSDDPAVVQSFRQEIVALAARFAGHLSGFSHHDGVNDPVELDHVQNPAADTQPPAEPTPTDETTETTETAEATENSPDPGPARRRGGG